MAEKYDYDVLIIGSGPGGYVAAIRAAQLGLKAAVIEKDKPGGVCLNVGCIPSKALVHQAEIFRSIQGLSGMGIATDLTGFDYKKVYAKSKAAADQLSRGIKYLLKKNNVEFVAAEAVQVRSGAVELKDGRTLTGNNIIIATGSSPREIPGFKFDEESVLSSTGILMLQELPQSLLVIGAGAIGVEFAHVMNAFGVRVHLVEMLNRILPLEDDESVDVLQKAFKKRGMLIYTSTRAVSKALVDGKLQVLLENQERQQEKIIVDKILVSVGRVPNTSSLGLDKTDIETDPDGYIKVGDYYQTHTSGIYAIGDVVRSPLLAHVASKEGEIAVEHIAGKNPKPRIDPLAIPGATYCEPQVASFGYTERRAKEESIAFRKVVFPYRGVGKSVAVEQTEGLVKILLDPETDAILGAHIVGAEATELIHELLLAKTSELLPDDIVGMIHAHPTFSEGILEAMRGTKDGAIHI